MSSRTVEVRVYLHLIIVYGSDCANVNSSRVSFQTEDTDISEGSAVDKLRKQYMEAVNKIRGQLPVLTLLNEHYPMLLLSPYRFMYMRKTLTFTRTFCFL